MERTLILFKPDAVQRRLCGRLLSRFEDKGLKLVGMKLMRISPELAAQHYEAHKERPFYKGLVEFMTSAPVVALVFEGSRAVSVARKMMGATFGFDAESGTIRGDFGISNQFNLIHGSDSAESAAREVDLFFKPEELQEYGVCDEAWLADE